MDKKEDFLISDPSFINFLLHGDWVNMTNVSWNASSTTKFSHLCLKSLKYGQSDIKKYSDEIMVMHLTNLFQLKVEETQVYKGPTGINSFIFETNPINAKKLEKFLKSKIKIQPKSFFSYFNIIHDFLSYCSLQLNKAPKNIKDFDLFDENLFINYVFEKKLSTSKINLFEKVFALYFSKEKFQRPKIENKNTEKFNHVVIERHLHELKHEFTKTTFNKRKREYKDFLNWLTSTYFQFQSFTINSVPLFLVTSIHLEEYKLLLLSHFQEGIYKKHTISDTFYNIRSLFQNLYQMGIIPNDITRNVNSIKFEKYKYRDLPTNQQLSDFFEAVLCYTPNPLIFSIAYKLMLYLGLRLNEVALLETSNINFGSKTISIKGKEDKYDILPLPKPLLNNLYSLVNLNNKFVFSDKPQKFKEDLYLYYKLLEFVLNWDFPGGVHLFRHTFITRLSEQPNPQPQVIQFLSRHSRPDTTSLYIHRDDKTLNSAINKINYF